MQFIRGSAVITAEGSEAGRVDRVVLRPESKEVTHIVVRKDSLLGLDSRQAKVVPVDLIASADAERVSLKPDAPYLEELADFEETEYIAVDQAATKQSALPTPRYMPTVYSTPTFTSEPVISGPEPAYVKQTKENIPEGSVALREGAKVVTAEGKPVGSMEQVLADSGGKATHVVVCKGLVQKARKLLPMTLVQEVEENQVRLAVGAKPLDEMEDYTGQPAIQN